MNNDVGAMRIAQMVAAIAAVLAEPTIEMRPVDLFDLERIHRQWTERNKTNNVHKVSKQHK